MSDGTVYKWGDPYKGQLGQYDKDDAWDHTETRKFSSPVYIKVPNQAVQIECAGIHCAVLTKDGELYTFGCGSDGRLGHPEYEGKVYLYKESKPKLVQKLFATGSVTKITCSYYHNIALVEPKKRI